MKKNLLYVLTLVLFLPIISCSKDDDSPPTPAAKAAPTITISTPGINMNTGEQDTFTITIDAEAGIQNYAVQGLDANIATVTLTGEPSNGDLKATVNGKVDAVANGQIKLIIAIQDTEKRSAQVELTITVIKGYDKQFASAYEFLTLRPEYKDFLFLLDKAELKPLYNNEVFEGNSEVYGDYYLQETLFFIQDGWLDKLIEASPFLDSRDDISKDLATNLFNNSRFQQRDNDAGAPIYRNNLNWATIVGSNAATPDNTNTITGGTMNVRNRGIVGSSRLYQSLVRPLAYSNTGIGYLDAATGKTPTIISDAIATDVEASVFPVTGEGDIPHVFIHTFEDLPFDVDAAFDDPQNHLDNVGQGHARNLRDVNILQNVYLMDSDVKWTMNSIDEEKGAYAGSASLYGVVIVPTSVYDDLNAIITPLDPNFVFGNTRAHNNNQWSNGKIRSVWSWDGGAVHIPDNVYNATADYWFKHWIPTEAVENGSLADGAYPNWNGQNITINGSSVTLDGKTVNVVHRFRYKDVRILYGRAGDGSILPSQEYQDATTAQGFKWVEVIIVDDSL